VLTLAVAAAGIWLYAARTPAAWIVASVIAVLWCVSGGAKLIFWIDEVRSQAAGAAYERAHRHTLAGDTIVDTMHLPAGTVVVTNGNFHIVSVELSKPAVLFGVPLKDTVGLRDAKLDGSQTLHVDAAIDDVPCAADSPVSFDSGKLTSCRLARPSTIGGVPCRGYIDIHAGFLGCELAASYEKYGVTWYEGTDVRGGEEYMTFTIGSRAPSLHVYGSPLTQGTIVVYRNGKIDMVTFITPLRYRGCAIAHVERRDGAMTADVEGPCSLRALPNGRIPVPDL
jgi:hypothetical protein